MIKKVARKRPSISMRGRRPVSLRQHCRKFASPSGCIVIPRHFLSNSLQFVYFGQLKIKTHMANTKPIHCQHVIG